MDNLLDTALALPNLDDKEKGIHKVVSGVGALVYELFGYAASEPGEDALLAVGWTTGGMSGGSCYGTRAQRYTAEGGPAEIELLTALLEAVAPAVTFLQYKSLLNAVQKGTHTVQEYYGNSTDYAYQYIPLSVVAERLKAWGYV